MRPRTQHTAPRHDTMNLSYYNKYNNVYLLLHLYFTLFHLWLTNRYLIVVRTVHQCFFFFHIFAMLSHALSSPSPFLSFNTLFLSFPGFLGFRKLPHLTLTPFFLPLANCSIRNAATASQTLIFSYFLSQSVSIRSPPASHCSFFSNASRMFCTILSHTPGSFGTLASTDSRRAD